MGRKKKGGGEDGREGDFDPTLAALSAFNGIAELAFESEATDEARDIDPKRGLDPGPPDTDRIPDITGSTILLNIFVIDCTPPEIREAAGLMRSGRAERERAGLTEGPEDGVGVPSGAFRFFPACSSPSNSSSILNKTEDFAFLRVDGSLIDPGWGDKAIERP